MAFPRVIAASRRSCRGCAKLLLVRGRLPVDDCRHAAGGAERKVAPPSNGEGEVQADGGDRVREQMSPRTGFLMAGEECMLPQMDEERTRRLQHEASEGFRHLMDLLSSMYAEHAANVRGQRVRPTNSRSVSRLLARVLPHA